mmetsp:Transcript_35888/g.81749  ORF Transcript_35888/g.81749 Transcript_35888/m.81749 type:complete len:209 (-) Transcript_35888:124-750(-)
MSRATAAVIWLACFSLMASVVLILCPPEVILEEEFLVPVTGQQLGEIPTWAMPIAGTHREPHAKGSYETSRATYFLPPISASKKAFDEDRNPNKRTWDNFFRGERNKWISRAKLSPEVAFQRSSEDWRSLQNTEFHSDNILYRVGQFGERYIPEGLRRALAAKKAAAANSTASNSTATGSSGSAVSSGAASSSGASSASSASASSGST